MPLSNQVAATAPYIPSRLFFFFIFVLFTVLPRGTAHAAPFGAGRSRFREHCTRSFSGFGMRQLEVVATAWFPLTLLLA
jgi:hypothetical protein